MWHSMRFLFSFHAVKINNYICVYVSRVRFMGVQCTHTIRIYFVHSQSWLRELNLFLSLCALLINHMLIIGWNLQYLLHKIRLVGMTSPTLSFIPNLSHACVSIITQCRLSVLLSLSAPFFGLKHLVPRNDCFSYYLNLLTI